MDKRSETGRHLFQDLDKRTNLEYVRYVDFPATCMPTSFSESLQEIELQPVDWSQGLLRGLKQLHNLKKFSFHCEWKFWDNVTLSNIRRPYADLLPIDSLDDLQLGFNCNERQPDGALQLSSYSGLHDTPHGQYLAGLRTQAAPSGGDNEGSHGVLMLDFSLQREKFKAIGKLRIATNQ